MYVNWSPNCLILFKVWSLNIKVGFLKSNKCGVCFFSLCRDIFMELEFMPRDMLQDTDINIVFIAITAFEKDVTSLVSYP